MVRAPHSPHCESPHAPPSRRQYCELDWVAEEFSGGCYVGLLPPHVLTSLGEQVTKTSFIDVTCPMTMLLPPHVAPRFLPWSQLRTPFGRVHFAGTELATIASTGDASLGQTLGPKIKEDAKQASLKTMAIVKGVKTTAANSKLAASIPGNFKALFDTCLGILKSLKGAAAV